MSGDATVWVQNLEGRWERMGADRVRGVWPEGQRGTANDWGPDTYSLLVRRDPGAVYPEILPFSPIDVEIDGVLSWSGFVWEPPQQADERAIAVECRGWQYHTDDDLLDRMYVHSLLSEWQDRRTNIATVLGTGLVSADYQVDSDAGIQISLADGVGASVGDRGGVLLDLGPGNTAKKVTWAGQTSNNNNSGSPLMVLELFGADSADGTTGVETLSSSALTSLGASFGPTTFTFTTPKRFLFIQLRATNLGGAIVNDAWAKLTTVIAYAQSAYESANASILKASDVVKDLLPFCPLLDQRTDLIQASAVNLPHFVLEENTPRQGMDQANIADGWQLRVTPERMLEYRARPTVPVFRTGAWAPDRLAGASRGSGEPIHNRALVKGNDSSGGRVVVERFAGQLAGVATEVIDSPGPDNPSFDVNTTSWAASAGALTRDTGIFDTSPASGKWDQPPAGATLTETFTGTFKRGQVYLLAFRWRTTGVGIVNAAAVRFGHLSSGDFGEIGPAAISSFVEFVIAWIPKADRSGVVLELRSNVNLVGTGVPFYVDSLTLRRTAPSIPDRRGFIRTRGIRVERPLTATDGQIMADASLRDAMRTALKGDQAAYRGDVRTFLGDGSVHPGHLLRNVGELMHQSHLVDPDTGSLGRDSRAVAVTYEDESVLSTVTLDNTRTDFETQLARYEVTGRR